MTITVEGNPKEIAALVVAIQERLKDDMYIGECSSEHVSTKTTC